MNSTKTMNSLYHPVSVICLLRGREARLCLHCCPRVAFKFPAPAALTQMPVLTWQQRTDHHWLQSVRQGGVWQRGDSRIEPWRSPSSRWCLITDRRCHHGRGDRQNAESGTKRVSFLFLCWFSFLFFLLTQPALELFIFVQTQWFFSTALAVMCKCTGRQSAEEG